MRAVFPGRFTTPQPIAIEEDYATESAAVSDARLATALGEDWHRTLHLGAGQQENVAH